MKKFENRTTTLKGEDDKKLKYSDLVLLCLDNPPKDGFGRIVNRERNRVEDALKAEKKGIIEMEDADFVVMQKVVDEMHWAARNKELEEFQDYICEL